jgi:hypothetical protein
MVNQISCSIFKTLKNTKKQENTKKMTYIKVPPFNETTRVGSLVPPKNIIKIVGSKMNHGKN